MRAVDGRSAAFAGPARCYCGEGALARVCMGVRGDPDDLMKVRWPAWCKARGIEDPFANPTPGPGRFAVIPRRPLIGDRSDIRAIKLSGHWSAPKAISIDVGPAQWSA